MLFSERRMAPLTTVHAEKQKKGGPRIVVLSAVKQNKHALIAHTLHTKAAQKDFEGSSKSLFQHKDRSKSKMRFHSKAREPKNSPVLIPHQRQVRKSNHSRRRKRFHHRVLHLSCKHKVNRSLKRITYAVHDTHDKARSSRGLQTFLQEFHSESLQLWTVPLLWIDPPVQVHHLNTQTSNSQF